MNLRNPLLPLAFVALAAPLATAGCGIIDTSEVLGVTVPLTYEIPVDIPVVYPGSERIAQLQAENKRSVDILAYVPVDLAQVSEQIAKADVIEEVRIESVTMEVISNTLEDVDIQPFEIRIGEPGTQVLGAEVAGAEWNSALVAAIVPTVEASTPAFTGVVPADVVPENRTAVAEQIAQLQFGVGMGTALSIEQGNLPEGGRADVRFTFTLAIRINPL